MTQPDSRAWSPCPPGEMGRLCGRLRRRKQRRRLLRSSAVSGAVIVLVAVGVLWVGRGGEPNHGGIRCSQVISAAADYRDDRLSDEVRSRIVIHVSQCPQCHEYYKNMGLIIQRSAVRVTSLAQLIQRPGSLPVEAGRLVAIVN